MKIKKIVRQDDFNNINYSFSKNKIIVNYNGQEETFNFNQYTEDGEFEVIPEILDINPFGEVKRKDGELMAEIIWLYSNPSEWAGKVAEWEAIE